MRCYLRLFPVGLLAVLLHAAPSWGVDLLTPGDPAVAFDLDPPGSASSSPGGELPAKAIDGTLGKIEESDGDGYKGGQIGHEFVRSIRDSSHAQCACKKRPVDIPGNNA